jgi:hypothetical protein
VAPIAPLAGSPASICPDLETSLTIPERRYAKAAWAYFKSNYHKPTGLVADRSNLDGVTVWGMGDYLAATHAALVLGLITEAEFDDRVRRFLGTLRRLPLFEGALPHRGYHLKTLQPVDYGTNPLPEGNGWSSIDIGRLMLVLYQLKSCHPIYADIIDRVLLGWSYLRVVRDGQLYDAYIKTDEFNRRLTRIRPVTQFGYEEYAARGFQLWGFEVNRSAVTRNYATAKVDDIEVPVRRQDRRIAHGSPQTGQNYLVSDPFIRYGLELGFDPLMQGLVEPIVAVQVARYQTDNILTAAATHRLEFAPYLLHSTIVGNDRPWANLHDDGTSASQNRLVSTAMAFGLWALFPNQAYGQTLHQAVLDLYNPSLGYYEGFDEQTGDAQLGFSNATNSLILQSLLYHHSQRSPLLALDVPPDSPWWRAVEAGDSGNGLPRTATPQIRLWDNGDRAYWVAVNPDPSPEVTASVNANTNANPNLGLQPNSMAQHSDFMFTFIDEETQP